METTGNIYFDNSTVYNPSKTNNMQKQTKMTAVDFIKSYLLIDNTWENIFEQAKQMEKEQIIDAHYQGYRNDIGTTEVSEQYYNETYGK